MKKTITETFDEEGRLLERVTVEEDTEATSLVPSVQHHYYWYGHTHCTCQFCHPYVWPQWQTVTTTVPNYTLTTGTTTSGTGLGNTTSWTSNGIYLDGFGGGASG